MDSFRTLYKAIAAQSPDQIDMSNILSGFVASDEETNLWDFKLSFPDKLDPGSDSYNYALESLMKDVVAFHNAYGGIIISGVDDKTRKVIGDDSVLDVDDMKKRLASATGAEIEIRFQRRNLFHDGRSIQIGMLFIPQRTNATPAAFKADAKARTTTGSESKKAYKKGVYLRKESQSRPVENKTEDWMFLISGDRFKKYAESSKFNQISLANNLRERDTQFITFVGRENELSELWRWLSDPYALIKVVSGYGGLGKTTLVRQFCEEVTINPPQGYYKLVWLTAKRTIFDVKLLDKRLAHKANEMPQFSDLVSLFRSLLCELAIDESEVPISTSSNDYLDLLIDQLRNLPCIIVVDDADSLLEQQNELFQAFSQILNRAFSVSKQGSRLIITTRQNLGAAGNQLLSVKGLDATALGNYAREVLKEEFGRNSDRHFSASELTQLHKTSNGSPLFSWAIIRLMRLQSCDLSKAIKMWQVPNGDGEAARYFVFGRELDRLSDHLKRILYAVAILNRTSQIELQQVLGLPPRAVRDDIIKLREFHLIADEQQEMTGGPDISLPPGLRALSDVMRSSISDPGAVERECKVVRTQTTLQSTKAVAIYINRITALWAEGLSNDALELANYANKQTHGQSADISCLLASCFLRASEPFFDADAADRGFAQSYKQGCRKIELFRGWIAARMALLNWDGVVQITNLADIVFPSGENAFSRATAYLRKGDGQQKAGSLRSAMDNYRRGAASVQDAFDGQRATGKVEALKEIRFELYDKAFFAAKCVFSPQADGVEIWRVVAEALKNHAPRAYMIAEGAQNLLLWARVIQNRSKPHQNTLKALDHSTGELQRALQEYAYMLARTSTGCPALCDIYDELIQIRHKYEDELYAIPSQNVT